MRNLAKIMKRLRSLAVFRHGTRLLGSLRVAVCLLAAFAVALFFGTWVEYRRDSAQAQELVYRAWWFLALLALLWVNILFAALKKWPWKRHQVGFLVTHLGLLTLVAGGIVNAFAGRQGTMHLVDADSAIAAQFGLHSMDFMSDRSIEVIQVKRARDAANVFRAEMTTAALAGRLRRRDADGDGLLTFLAWLAHPFRPEWTLDLGEWNRLEVLEMATARQRPFSPAVGASHGFPALRLQMASAETGPLPPRWLAGHDPQRTVRIGPGLIEILGQHCRPEQLAEFARPPVNITGNRGQLVVGLAGQTQRFDVAAMRADVAVALASSDWRMRVTQYLPNYRQAGEARAGDPALALEVSRGNAPPMAFALSARRAGQLFPMNSVSTLDRLPADLWFWYHPADFRYADENLRAILQFVADRDGKLHYRSFSSAGGKGFSLEGSGSVGEGSHRIWRGMHWRFQVLDYLTHATPRPMFTQETTSDGLEDRDAPPALKCRLSRDGAATEFWVGKTEGGFLPIQLAGEEFLVGYHAAVLPLGFTITLARAEQATDSGSARPAGQTSYIYLTDPERGLHQQPHVVALNQPLYHRGYRIYQSGYDSLGMDPSGRPVSRAILTLRSDPGLYLKYVGSIMIALGIACMFYMRAYF